MLVHNEIVKVDVILLIIDISSCSDWAQVDGQLFRSCARYEQAFARSVRQGNAQFGLIVYEGIRPLYNLVGDVTIFLTKPQFSILSLVLRGKYRSFWNFCARVQNCCVLS